MSAASMLAAPSSVNTNYGYPPSAVIANHAHNTIPPHHAHTNTQAHIPTHSSHSSSSLIPNHSSSSSQRVPPMTIAQIPPYSGPSSSSVATDAASTSVASVNSAAIAASSSSSSNSDPSKKKQAISYAADRVIGTGSFGVVYEAKVLESGESVAIKKVLQDRRFKNRELQIMSQLQHPNVIGLRHCFYSKGDTAKTEQELYLNLVMDYIGSTIHRTLRDHCKANRLVPIFLTRLYIYQICRAVHYIHTLGICHRDIKPQNLLLEPKTHLVRLCDFGSAKVLNPAEPNVSYICSRYYRAPELVFEATSYTTAIDIWSLGAVMGELLLGSPLFPGDSSVDQLIVIIKLLGSPTKEELHSMNPHNTSFKFPLIQPTAWSKVFHNKAPQDAIDLISLMLRYDPKSRIEPLDALAHPFFDPLRADNAGEASQAGTSKNIILPSSLFQFTHEELRTMKRRGTLEKIIPARLLPSIQLPID